MYVTSVIEIQTKIGVPMGTSESRRAKVHASMQNWHRRTPPNGTW